MNVRTIATLIAALAIVASGGGGGIVDDELWIPVAGRGQGAAGSFWVTNLWLMNPGEDALEVEITFLDQTSDNTGAEPVTMTLEAGQTLVLRDLIATKFGEESAFGALHIEGVEDEGEGEEDEAAALEPGARDRKVYCPGYGNVYDDGLELVSSSNAPAP